MAYHDATLSGIGGYLAEACPTATGLVQLRMLAAATWERWERARVIGEEIGRDLNEPLAFGPSNVAI